MKKYFDVCVSKYVKELKFRVSRPASLNNPRNNAVMFILESRIEEAYVFESVEQCLIFWPRSIHVPETIEKKHAIYRCDMPHTEFCRFFRDNHITYLPQKEKVLLVDGAYIAIEARIGKNATILPGAYIGGGCTIGDDVYIGSGAKLVGDVTVGDRVVIRENAVIGADGLTTDREEDGTAVTMPQFGSVVIEDDVQIGANTVIARGAIDETRICKGSKIDNLSFISHNVTLGENTFIVGETIMFGGSSTGRNSMISGNSTIRNAVHIGDGALVGMGSVVTKNVPIGTTVKGNPAK